MPVSEAEVKPDKPFGGAGAPLAPKKKGDVDRATFSVAVKSASPLTNAVTPRQLPCKSVKDAGKKRMNLWFTNPEPRIGKSAPHPLLKSGGMP